MNKKISSFTATLLVLVALGSGGIAQAATPEEFVKEYLSALQTRGFAAAPDFIHPEELTRFKEMLMPLIRKEATKEEDRPLTQALVGPDAKLEVIEAMSGAEFMSALLNIVGGRLQGLKFQDGEVLGSVRESDVVHVVTRVGVNINSLNLRQMEVVSVRPDGGSWKLKLSGEFEGLAAALSAQ